MGNERVNAEQEKRLFADVELIKQKQEHTDNSVSSLLREFVAHSKTTNDHLSKLALSTQELVLESRTANKRIDDVEEIQIKHESDFRVLGKRIVDLENFKLACEKERELKDRQSKFWSDNWHKMLMIFIISIPVIVAVYNLVNQ